MKLSGLYLLIAFFSFSAFAEQFLVNDFHRRFKIHKDSDNNSVMILDRVFHGKFNIAPYVEFIKEAVVYQQQNFNNKEQSDLIAELTDSDKKYAPIIMDSMHEINKLDIDKALNNPKFRQLISRYEQELSNALARLSFGVLANMEEPTFFYHRRVTYEVTKMAMNLAKRWLSSVPVLNTAMYIIVEVERLIRERRLYHQNMLLHYLDKLKPEEMGLTHSEVSRAWSSIYESRIPWYAFWESNNAKANWEKYGPNNFYMNFRMASSRLRNHRQNYVEIRSRINYGFQEVVSKDHGRVILNLVDPKDQYSSSPSIAYYYSDPNKVVKMRLILTVARLGLSFVPIPQFVKDMGDSFLKSRYINQSLTEGALFAHFESINDTERSRQVLAQALNPFEQLFESSFKEFNY